MEELKLLAIGTPVIDKFARAGPDVLKKWGLAQNSSNFMDFEKLEKLEKSLGKAVFLTEAGDNARNVADTFARLEKIRGPVESVEVGEGQEDPQTGEGADRPLRGSVAYVGSVGSDKSGDIVARSLQEAGVQSLLCTAGGRTGEIVCLIAPDGARTFAVSLGVSKEYPMDVPLPDSDMLFATSITALGGGSLAWVLEHQMTHAADIGIPIALSMESAAMLSEQKEKAIALAARADYLFLNDEEMRALGLTVKQTAELAATVFLKRGAAGSTIFDEGRKEADIPAFSAQALDTTGAGDAYAAGVLWGLSRDMTVAASARLGSRLGAAVVGKFGAGIPENFKLE